MTHGVFLSVAETVAILAAVLVLAVFSSLVYLRPGEVPERRSVALFWACLAVTWLLAVVAAVAMQPTRRRLALRPGPVGPARKGA